MEANLQASIKPAFNLLKGIFGIVPIIAGLDKFSDVLEDWEKYSHTGIAAAYPLHLIHL